MTDACIDQVPWFIAGCLFVLLFIRWIWDDFRGYRQREDMSRLYMLRDRYTPGKNQEERERRELEELEAKWRKP